MFLKFLVGKIVTVSKTGCLLILVDYKLNFLANLTM